MKTLGFVLLYGMLTVCTFMLLVFAPSIYRYLRDDMRLERLFWLRRRVARWYKGKQDQILGFLVVLVGFALVWLGLIILTPAQ
ncbi:MULTISPECIES: hypothetical protein [unclassified Spirosoma]|uniref:hypothetical protein n=1 Tax=unclassified Spirosoma TaxID=2621999 RepID=UPI00095AADFD|nr:MULTISPECIES: hypothetical protein [unclassified Spirosoma]MBN8825101.1 hypothetical protein [Spirosoma sp.]OJW77207.1 MAG: hypothetical protein BGO59_31635 [Spirosoma sp. 48-14]